MSWHAEYAILILFSTVLDYSVGLLLGSVEKLSVRRMLLLLSLCINLGLLFSFKYFNFFAETARDIGDLFGYEIVAPSFSLLLPVGISFYTFQTLSYTIDCYTRRIIPERHFGKFALYVSFFPQLVAGPIERADRLLPQLSFLEVFSSQRLHTGALVMLIGFFKKVVIADNVSAIADTVYASPQAYIGLPLLIATICFAIQIYCDFSGYCDIAIGSAHILGVSLMDNFAWPYKATSIKDFWNRWHISLSQWFRDYIYFPLGGSRASLPFVVRNALIVFAISGLWHGAAWTFVLWGVYHGVLYAMEIAVPSLFLSGSRFWRVVRTMIFVHVGWILFRSQNLQDALYVIRHLFTGIFSQIQDISVLKETLGDIGVSKTKFVLILLGILLVYLAHVDVIRNKCIYFFHHSSRLVRWSVLYTVLFIVIFLGNWSQHEFIYFQF